MCYHDNAPHPPVLHSNYLILFQSYIVLYDYLYYLANACTAYVYIPYA